jgi:hypothetical protein
MKTSTKIVLALCSIAAALSVGSLLVRGWNRTTAVFAFGNLVTVLIISGTASRYTALKYAAILFFLMEMAVFFFGK